MKIVNTYEDLQSHAIRFIINIHDVQSYKIDTSNLHRKLPTTDFKFLLARNYFKLINKPNT